MSIELPHNKDINYFAKTHYRNTEKIFGIQRKDRRQHMYVLGKSGMGKSTLLSNMVLQDIRNGDGVCVVDPHGEMVEDLLGVIPKERLDDVVYFNPADIDYHVGFNVLEVYDEKYKHLVASGIMGIFTKIWANVWSSRMEYILNNCILALIDTPGSTLLGIPRMLVEKDYRQNIVNNIKDPVVRTFWVHEYEVWEDRYRKEAIAPIQNKVGQFLSNSIVRNILGQKKSTVNIAEIMNTQKIFLVNLSKGRVGEDNSALLGAMLITKIQLAAMERVKIAEHDRKDFYLYVDEFQNFVTDSFASILSEARKYRLNLIIAHQYVAQLEADNNTVVRDAVFGNVGTMIVGRVGAADAAFLETEFMPEFTPDDFVSLPNYHAYLKMLVNGMTTRPFSAKTLPPIVKMETDPRVEQYITARSRKLYHRPRKDVESEITKWSNGEEEAASVEVDEDGLGNDGKYRSPCSFDDCDHVAVVPFKPEAGRPVYCRDCIAKIKAGDKSPISNRGKDNKPAIRHASREGLASLGIEFKSNKPMNKKEDKTTNRSSSTSRTNPRNNSANDKYKKPIPTKSSATYKPAHDRNPPSSAKKPFIKRPPLSSKPTTETPKKTWRPEKKESSSHIRRNYQKNEFTPKPRQATSADRSGLQGLLSEALGDFKKTPEDKPPLPDTPTAAPVSIPAQQSISLSALNESGIKEEIFDLEEKYKDEGKKKEVQPGRPKFDPTKQASDDKLSALRAALAKTKPQTNEQVVNPVPSTSRDEAPQVVQNITSEVPGSILQKILADDDE